MSEEKEIKYDNTILENPILLQFEGFIKFISGFLRGIESVEKVNSSVVVDCMGEMLEFLNSSKEDIMKLFKHCETVLAENESLLEEVKQLHEKLEASDVPLIEEKQPEVNDGE